MSLVDYGSSDDESTLGTLETQEDHFQGPQVPKLPDSFSDLYRIDPRRGDDPAFHQGRVRVHNHVNGEWPAHIYLDFWPSKDLTDVLQQVTASVNTRSLQWQSLLFNDLRIHQPLHVSLSRPLMLGTDQKDVLLAALLGIQVEPMHLGFDKFDIFCNEEKTREFLVIKLSQEACSSLGQLCHEIDSILLTHHLPLLYQEPQFHVSFAWRQLDGHDFTKQIAKLNIHHTSMLQRQHMACNGFRVKVGKDIFTNGMIINPSNMM